METDKSLQQVDKDKLMNEFESYVESGLMLMSKFAANDKLGSELYKNNAFELLKRTLLHNFSADLNIENSVFDICDRLSNLPVQPINVGN